MIGRIGSTVTDVCAAAMAGEMRRVRFGGVLYKLELQATSSYSLAEPKQDLISAANGYVESLRKKVFFGSIPFCYQPAAPQQHSRLCN